MAGEKVLNGRYELEATQGSGGMSVIYRALDRSLGRHVAVKILRPSLTQDPSFVAKFQNEARSIANLQHPNIVTVHDVGNDGPTYYIVMELVEGLDLKKIITSSGALPLERAVDLGIQICDGLGYAHRSGIVHADVKPQNVLITKTDIVKVTDFGIAQALTDTQPQQRAEVVWGSPHYFAPEQARGDQPSPSSDVYSIGIVLFEMVTGELPYMANSQQALAMSHIRDRIPLATERNPNVPEALAKIIHRVMSKEPQRRFQSADQLGAVLKKYREDANANTSMNVAPPPPNFSQQRPPAVNPPSRPMPVNNQPPISSPPNFNVPPPPPNADPTLKISAAPYAPTPQNYNQPRPVNTTPGIQQPQPFEQRVNIPPPNTGSLQESRSYSASYPPMTSPEEENAFDGVTIVLAVLAFIAVAGLVPLFIAVIAVR